jgi:hypothetical protein
MRTSMRKILQEFFSVYITESIENSDDNDEYRALSLTFYITSEKKQQSSKHYENSLMILFCVVRLIAKITLK